MTQIEMISTLTVEDFQIKVNEFIKHKLIVDIKYQLELQINNTEFFTAMIIYNEIDGT